jgi:uncharacterized protein YggE
MRRTSVAAAMALFAGALTVGLPVQAEAQQTREGHGHMEGTALVITAEALVAQAPDLATVSAGVLTEGRTAEAALAENARKMNGVMTSLRQSGIAPRDIQTSNISLNPQYVYNQNETPRITGYQATNTVTVRVRNLDNLGRTLDSLVGQGGNQLQGVSFSIDKADQAMDAARRDAMKKARARADLYAEAAGLRVSRIVSISEGGAVPPPMPMPTMMARMATDSAPPPTPVSAGEVSVSASVTVMFELK